MSAHFCLFFIDTCNFYKHVKLLSYFLTVPHTIIVLMHIIYTFSLSLFLSSAVLILWNREASYQISYWLVYHWHTAPA